MMVRISSNPNPNQFPSRFPSRLLNKNRNWLHNRREYHPPKAYPKK